MFEKLGIAVIPTKLLVPDNTNHRSDFGDIVEVKLFVGIVEHGQLPSPFMFAVSQLLSVDFPKSSNALVIEPKAIRHFFSLG
jgi:hypothetical protein